MNQQVVVKQEERVRLRRTYKKQNVFEATQERIAFMFEEFPRMYVSFSGGKDSGVMLNLIIDYMRKHGITKKVGVMILDNEANYEHSLSFMHSILSKNLDILDVYWCCLPLPTSSKSSISSSAVLSVCAIIC